MDSDIGGWILEFILRHQALDDRTLNSLLTVLPLPPDNFSLKKSLLLRRITSETADDTVSDAVLDLLELTEELEHTEGLPSTESMKRAYCHVAVDLTFKALDDASEYFEMVKSVWRGRVARMGDCGLVSDELMTWMDEVEAAVWDRDARGRVQKKGRVIDAVGAVRAYVAEAWEGLGSAFLDDVVEMAASDGAVRDVLGLGVGNEASKKVEQKSDDVVGDSGNANRNNDTATEVLDLGDNLVLRHDPVINDGNDANRNDTTTNVVGLGDENDQVLRQDPVITDGNNPKRNNDITTEVLGSGDDPVLCQDPVISEGKNVSQNSTRLPRRKHLAKKRSRGSIGGTSRGAKISDTEQVDNKEILKNYGCLPSPAIHKLHEALKVSSLELHANVIDPLPEAIQIAENVMSERANVPNEADPKSPCTSHENNVLKPSLMTRNKSACTYEWDDSIDGSAEDGSSSGNRIKLPSPKNRVVSPLKKYEMSNIGGRRKGRKWSVLEEDTLRAGVEKYGKGCWKAILNAYPDILEGRTEVDLKDKWRNLTRYPR